jgi:hypothetical protein
MSNRYIGSVQKKEGENYLYGTIAINGKEFWINVYPRETDGKKWFSVAMSEKKPKVDLNLDDSLTGIE